MMFKQKDIIYIFCVPFTFEKSNLIQAMFNPIVSVVQAVFDLVW